MGENIFSALEDLPIPKGNYVLVLPGWYPTWFDPYPGDFNQRHVISAGLFTTQLVLYIGKDKTGIIKKTETSYTQLSAGVFEVRVIYPTQSNKAIDVIYSNIVYLKLFWLYTGKIKRLFGIPMLVHSYIVMRGGLGGWLLKKRWKLPYILTENWTIYYPEDPGYLPGRNAIFQKFVRKIFKDLNHFLPVTRNLQMQAEKLTNTVASTVIPNVVNTEIFFYDEKPVDRSIFRFVHVSTMTYQKNPEGLLRAFQQYHKVNSACTLQMVGPYPPEVLKYARGLGLGPDVVNFTGGKSYVEVAELLHQGHALVLFSRYENLPCVILEALCCGLPVISTRVGGINEVIDETNGILIDNNNEAQLELAFRDLVDLYDTYNKKNIAENASSLYNYNTVGQQISHVYASIGYK